MRGVLLYTLTKRPRTPGKYGQSLIESCLAMGMICLVFLGVLQLSQLAAAREVLHHAAARGARARTVGFNWWMVEKSIRVASIPNAGKMIVPEFENEDAFLRDAVSTMRPGNLWDLLLGAAPSSMQYEIERARIPEYMASHNGFTSQYVLDYSRWDSIHGNHGDILAGPDPDTYSPILHVSAWQTYSNWVPMHRTFYASDFVDLRGEAYLENHYPLYIDDMGW